MKNLGILASLLYFSLLLIITTPVIAQYRRRHADITRELTRLLRESKPQDYYFSLLAPPVSRFVCKCAKIDANNELEKALSEENKERCIFLRSLSPSNYKNALLSRIYWHGSIFAARLYVSLNPTLSIDPDSPYWAINDPFMVAAEKGYSHILRLFLDAGADPNQKGGDENKLALRLALENEHWECAKMLIAAGADPNKRGSKFRAPPLVLAVKKNNLEMVKLLVGPNTKINKRATYDHNALFYAAENNNLEMVELLLAWGVDATHAPDTFRENLSSPLQEAAIHGNLAMVRLLLAAGAPPDVRSFTKKIGESRWCGLMWYGAWKIECPKDIKDQIEKLLEPLQELRAAKLEIQRAQREKEQKEWESTYLSLLPYRAGDFIRLYVREKNGAIIKQKRKKQKEMALFSHIYFH